MAVHGVFVTFKVIAPDKIKQAFTTVTLARVRGQKSDEIKLFWRELNPGVVERYFSFININPECAIRYDRRGRLGIKDAVLILRSCER